MGRHHADGGDAGHRHRGTAGHRHVHAEIRTDRARAFRLEDTELPGGVPEGARPFHGLGGGDLGKRSPGDALECLVLLGTGLTQYSVHTLPPLSPTDASG